jgi:predicted RNA-binding Zn-ribbon protein involved in translation (DUF1610 family)
MPKLPHLTTTAPPPVDRRPRCVACRERLKPNITTSGFLRASDGLTLIRVERSRAWDGTYGDREGFCGPLCAARFGRTVRRMLSHLPTACPQCGASIVNPWPENRS